MNKSFFTIACLVMGFLSGTKKSALWNEKNISIRDHEYKWKEVVKPGNGSFEENWKEGKWPMAITPVVAFDNKLWMIGRKNSWSSDDGIKWSRHSKIDWDERYGMGFVFFKNKLWMLGGMRAWDDFRNDIWCSDDGKKWNQVVSNAPWSQRRDHQVIVFKNKMWVIGGGVSSGHSKKLPTKALNDIWSSDDGINWQLVSNNAPWQGKDVAKILVFKNKIWMIGGVNHYESWCSEDGKTWRQVTSKVLWNERRGNGVLLFSDKLWVFGGINLNDVWFSSDGIEWKMFGNAPWSPRSTGYSVVFDKKLWIFSGKTGREDSWSGDIWTLENKTAD